jgi:4'-phosphopantetheinyl transferase
MKIWWLEQCVDEMPPGENWLSPGEKLHLGTMRFHKRRSDWRLGRWTAKRAIADYLEVVGDSEMMARIEIRPAVSGAPEVFLDNHPAQISISISHRGGIGVCTVAPPDMTIGCDLELIEARSQAFLADYFTATEQALVSRAPLLRRVILSNLIWSAKESALKALKVGLRYNPRSVEVCLNENCLTTQMDFVRSTSYMSPFGASEIHTNWLPLSVTCTNGQCLQGRWLVTDELVRTIVVTPTVEGA